MSGHGIYGSIEIVRFTSFFLVSLSFGFISKCVFNDPVECHISENGFQPLCEYSVIDTIILDSDSIYYKYFDYGFVDDRSLLCILNEITKSIQVFDLNIKQEIFNKPILSYGLSWPDDGFINGVDFVSFDSFFVGSAQKIWLLDSFAVRQEWDIPRFRVDRDEIRLYNLDHSPMCYSPCTGSFLFQSYTTSQSASSVKFYEPPVSAALDIHTGQVALLSVFYPTSYKLNYYGFANMVFRTNTSCRSIYAFPIDPYFYIYNHSTKMTDTICARSSYDTIHIDALDKKDHRDTELKLSRMTQMPFYLKVIEDPFDGGYYRFFYPYLSSKNSKGEYNTWSDKNLVLMHLDETFSIVSECILGPDEYSYFRSFVGNEGLYLEKVRMNNNSNERVSFHLIKFN